MISHAPNGVPLASIRACCALPAAVSGGFTRGTEHEPATDAPLSAAATHGRPPRPYIYLMSPCLQATFLVANGASLSSITAWSALDPEVSDAFAQGVERKPSTDEACGAASIG